MVLMGLGRGDDAVQDRQVGRVVVTAEMAT